MRESLEVGVTGRGAAGNCSTAAPEFLETQSGTASRNGEEAGAEETRKPAVDEGKASKGYRA